MTFCRYCDCAKGISHHFQSIILQWQRSRYLPNSLFSSISGKMFPVVSKFTVSGLTTVSVTRTIRPQATGGFNAESQRRQSLTRYPRGETIETRGSYKCEYTIISSVEIWEAPNRSRSSDKLVFGERYQKGKGLPKSDKFSIINLVRADPSVYCEPHVANLDHCQISRKVLDRKVLYGYNGK